jgi:hypothetical protein
MVGKLLKNLSIHRRKKAFELGIQEGKQQSVEAFHAMVSEAGPIE